MNDIYATPDANLDAGVDENKVYPGLRRLPYFLYSLGVNLVYILVIGGLAAMEIDSVGIAIAAMVVVVAVSIWLVVRRLQNLGSNPWWAVGLIVPLLNIWIGLKTVAFPEGYDDHKTLDTAAKVIIGLAVGAAILGVAAAVLMPSVAQ